MARTFDEAACLAIIATDEEDARSLLLREMPEAEREFKRVDKAIRDLLAKVQKRFPDAQYYTASGGFNLLLGRSHGDNLRGQQELVALAGNASIGDGDF